MHTHLDWFWLSEESKESIPLSRVLLLLLLSLVLLVCVLVRAFVCVCVCVCVYMCAPVLVSNEHKQKQTERTTLI